MSEVQHHKTKEDVNKVPRMFHWSSSATGRHGISEDWYARVKIQVSNPFYALCELKSIPTLTWIGPLLFIATSPCVFTYVSNKTSW